MRLSDLYRRDAAGGPLLTWRELGVYVRQLPRDARTRIALGDNDGLWGLAEHLLAMNLDAAHVANWQRANEGLKSHEQSRPPEPIERPGTARRKKITSAELLAHRERARAHLHAVAA
ncbi:hypothetical protein ACFQ9H_19575 [Streptomyces sp. NPDC056517]|uniref:hypothetical protein n=1 Tax=Streptomyces sp. NPDC056517 TaxID=3345848 RepID=UPI00367759D1